MIAGEQRPRFDERETEVVRGVPRCRDRLDRPAVARNPLAVGQDAVGRIIGVEGRIGARAIVVERQRRAADDRRAGRFLERRGGRRMVAVGVRAEDRRDALAFHRAQDGIDMPRAVDVGGIADAQPRPGRTRIDHRHIAARADDPRLGAGEGIG